MKCAAAAEKRLKERGAEYRIHYTNAPKHATEIARELSKTSDTIVARGRGDAIEYVKSYGKEYDMICCSGGDGTINEVFNGIDVDKVKLGLIPCGSGNDFVASANIPTDTEAAVDLILDGEAKPTDFMVCGGVRGLNIIGTGIDVDILKRCRKSKILKGKLQYVFSLVISLIKFVFYKFYIITAEKEILEL